MYDFVSRHQPEQIGPAQQCYDRILQHSLRSLDLLNLLNDMTSAVVMSPDPESIATNGEDSTNGFHGGFESCARAAHQQQHASVSGLRPAEEFISFNGVASEGPHVGGSSSDSKRSNHAFSHDNYPNKRRKDNIALTYQYDEYQDSHIGKYGGTPWYSKTKKYDNKEIK